MFVALHASLGLGECLLGFAAQHVELRMDALLWVRPCGMLMLRLPWFRRFAGVCATVWK